MKHDLSDHVDVECVNEVRRKENPTPQSA